MPDTPVVPLIKTPAVRVVETLFDGRAYIVELPVNAQTVIVEGTSFPPDMDVPQTFPRVYSIVGKKASGSHAHRAGTEDEIMFAPAGHAQVHLWDEDGEYHVVDLKPPECEHVKFYALFIRSGIWHTVRYAPNTVLNVVASVHYNREYYVEKPEDYFTPQGLANYLLTFGRLD